MSFGKISGLRHRHSRESGNLLRKALGNMLWSDWIPSFAGMTGGSRRPPFQMTSLPSGDRYSANYGS